MEEKDRDELQEANAIAVSRRGFFKGWRGRSSTNTFEGFTAATVPEPFHDAPSWFRVDWPCRIWEEEVFKELNLI